ncbi:hypothetical protein [Streptomyces sp. NBC_01483]|uniref:hypothetical protein n=1 Tax=Streptomyces sp. NBC_01483 TaxID=2903883 RepID=UPI002E334E97|nr:hypothetical protein [Streptomyces sp. NBC_01483]
MGSWTIAVVIVAAGSLCLRFRAGQRLPSAVAASLIVAFFTYLMGAGEVVFADPARMCQPTATIPDWDNYEEGLFPPRAACRWADGSTEELVSSWVNPLLFIALGVALACLIALVVSHYRKGSPS